MNNTLNLQGERLGLVQPNYRSGQQKFCQGKKECQKAYPRSPTRKDGIGQQEKKHEQSMPGIRII